MKHRITAIATALILALCEQGQVICVQAAEAALDSTAYSGSSFVDGVNYENGVVSDGYSYGTSGYSLLDEEFPDEDNSIVVMNGDEVFAAVEEVNPIYVDVEPSADISLSITPDEELIIQRIEQEKGQADAAQSDNAQTETTQPGLFSLYNTTADAGPAAAFTDPAYTFDEGEVQQCTTYAETAPIIVSAFQSRAEEIVVPINIRTGAEFEKEYREIEADDTLTVKEQWNRKFATFYRHVWRNALEHNPADPAAGDYMAYLYGGYTASYDGTTETANGSALFKGSLTYRMYNYKTDDDKAHDIRNSRYYTDLAQEAEVSAAIGPVLDSIITEGMTDKQKIEAIYDYICQNVAYDYTTGTDFIKYTAYGALIRNKSVCQGFSTLFYRMALTQGIDIRVVSGYGKASGAGGNHAWNCVKLGDVYYLCDSTWDSKRTSYTWLLKGEDDFTGHVPNYTNDRVVISGKETGARPNWFKEENYPIDALNWDDDKSMADYFALNFSGNGAGAGNVPAARTLTRQQTTSWIRANAIIKETIDSCDLTRDGYLFDGWNTAADGSGKDYGKGVPVLELPKLGDAVKAPESEDDLKMTLYAQWAPLWGDVTEQDHAQFASYEAFMNERAQDPVWIAALPSPEVMPDMYVYSGKPLTWGDAIHVYDVKKRLVPETDYTVSYANNTDAGDAEVTVTFVGNNMGEKVITWKIGAVDISSAAFKLEGTSKRSDDTVYLQSVANGSAQKPKIYLYWNGTLLTEDADFTVTADGDCKEPGTYKLTLTGTGNFTGTRTLDFAIVEEYVPAPDVEIENVSVNDLRIIGLKKKVTFDKEGAKQTGLSISEMGGSKLTQDVDYRISYRWPADQDGNLISGTAHVIIEGTGSAKGAEYAVNGRLTRYVGSRVISYTVKPISLTGVRMKGFVKSFVYDGNEHYQDFSENGVRLYTAAGMNLEEDVDFSVSFSPKNPVNAGKVTMKITGIGGFTGKLTKKYTIAKRSISGGDLMVFIQNENDVEDGTEGVFYMKGGAKPVPDVWLEGDPGDIELVKGTDFKLSYRKNTQIGKAYLKLTGKGNFKGSSDWYDFQVIKRDLNDDIFSVTVPVAKYSETPGKSLVRPVIKDINGKKLVKGKDYTIENYWLVDPESGIMTVISKKESVPFDSVVNVEIFAKRGSGYIGSCMIPYRVVYYDIAAAKGKLVPAAFEYTGEPINPLEIAGTTLDMTRGEEPLIPGVDYEVFCDENINVGSYTMTLRGIDRYGGEKKINYRITRRKLWQR